MAAFTPGNIVVLRVGAAGGGALSTAATAVFLDEYTPAGVFVQSIPMPTADSGANQMFTLAGSQVEGFLTLSTDGRYLVMAGYDAAVGTAAVGGTAAGTVNRVIGRVGADGVVDTTTALNDAGGNMRGAASTNGTDLWITSSTSGIRYATYGATTSTQISTTVTNLRTAAIFDGQLYISSMSGAFRIATVGTGTPTTSGQTITNLPGAPTTGSANTPYQFVFADLTAAVAGVDTMYLSDDRSSPTGGIFKFSLVGGTWVLNGQAAGSIRGLTGSTSGTTVSLYGTTGTASANSLVSLVDTGGYNATFSSTTFTTLATAAANTVFRGVAFAPQAAPAAGDLSIADNSVTEGNSGTTQLSFTVTRANGSAGAVSATWTISFSGSADASDLAAAQSLTGTVNFAAGETSKNIVVDINGDVTVEPNETFTITLSAPQGGVTLSDAVAIGTITNDDVPPAAGDLSIADNSVTEGNSGTTNLVFTVTRANGSAGAVDATWTISFGAGDNANAADLAAAQALTGTVSFADGETSKQISVGINGDLEIEPNETFTITLSAPTGGATLADAVATGTIITDDFTPVPGTLSINDVSVNEGNAGSTNATFTVTRSGGDDGAVSATWTLGFGTADAADFANGQATSGTVNFADGEISKTITIAIAGDTVMEANETYTVTLSAPTGGASIGDGSGAGTIVNNDVNVFINEIHYDDAGTDAGEAIEIAAAAGTDLAGWSLVLYNFTGGAQYSTINLSGIIPNQDDGYGTLSFAALGLQNGPNDGIALVAPGGIVVQFLSYEGVLTATNGPAAGMTSTDIGVSEEPAPADGLSMQLIGTGSSYGDFHWTSGVPFTFGAVNTNQDFLGTATIGQIRVDDPSVIEGNSGTRQLIFTVSRAGGLGGSGSVDYTIALNGTADSADIAPGAVFTGTVSFAPGEYSKQVAIGIQGDLTGEPNETLSITLSNPQGSVAIADANGTGTIVNDDPIPLAIHDIQGAGHTSPVVGQPVITSGIVTAIDTNGYYIQDPNPDANDATSEGIFVFTSTAPTGVAVGDSVTVTATVSEFTAAAGALSVTELIPSSVLVNSTGNALPAATLIGAGGRTPPTAIFEDDGFGTFDPATDGLDFYESMEGMRVTVQAPLVVANTNSFGETWVVASGGVGATTISDRYGITISDGDLNPERIQIDDDSGIFAGYTPNHSQGDVLGDVTGIMNYSQSSYEVIVTQAVTTTTDRTLTPEITTLDGDADHLAIATYNLENIDPTDPQQKFDVLAGNIVFNLSAPDIIAVQEIQDADGAGSGTNYSGHVTADRLIAAIDALGGPHYVYIEIAPTANNQTGGEPNGNIRPGYLYNPDRVSFVTGSLAQVPGSAFNGSRSPLAADFTFNGTTITLINMHSTSRGGSDDLEGSNQPPNDAGDGSRTAQAQAVRAYIDAHLADNPNLHFGVLGDFNGFYFEDAIESLTAGGVLTDLHMLNPVDERYSYLFDGNLQAIDHILFTGGLLAGAQYDPVHINAEAAPGTFRGTDHDPQLALLLIPAPNVAPALDLDGPGGTNDFSSSYIEGGAAAAIADTDVTITDGNLSDDIVSAIITITNPETGDKLNVGTLPAGVTVDDSSTDTMVKLVAAPGTSADTFEAAIQAVTYSSSSDDPTDGGTNASRSITVVVNDGNADSNTATAHVAVTDVNDAPAGTSSTINATEDTFRLISQSDLGFSDVDGSFASVTISGVTGGKIYFDADGSAGAGTPAEVVLPQTYTAQDLADGKVLFRADPNLNGDGAATITFAVTDDDGATDSTPNVLTVNVAAVEDVAVLADDSATTDEASSVVIDVLANDGDDVDGPNQPGGQKPLIIEIDSQSVSAGGTVTLGSGAKVTFNNDGTLTYDPNGAFNSLVPASSGAANGSAEDSFTYTVAGNASANVTVTVNGLASAGDIYKGDDESNTITGTAGPDFFLVNQGGNDDLSGLGGNDVFLFGATLTGDDKVDGGAGNDQIAIQGDYSAGVTFGTEVVSIESLAILPGSDTRFGDPGTNFYDYDLTTVDENVAAGATMTVDANRLRVDEDFTFDGSAETDGAFFIYGGGGTDTLTGGAKNDVFYFGENGQFGASDHVDGGPGGNDQLALRGDYTIVFGATQLVSIESIGLVSAYDTRFGPLGTRYDYNLTMNDGNVAAGQQMTVDAAPLRADETFTFNGSAELDGSFRIYGGHGTDSITGSQGNDRICGGQGGDTLRGGGGDDVFVYRSVLDSPASGDRDGIQDFTTGDKIDLSAIDAIVGGGTSNDAFTFIGSSAFSHTAGELQATLSGGIWTISGDVDGDGAADIQFFVVRGDPNPIVATDFVL